LARMTSTLRMDTLFPSFAIVALVALLVWSARYKPRSLNQEVQVWAEQLGLKILKKERRYIFAGPFTWDRAGAAFRIEAQTNDGKRLSGWVKFGYRFGNKEAWSHRVVWDQ